MMMNMNDDMLYVVWLVVNLAGQLQAGGVSMSGFGQLQHQSSGLNSGLPMSHSVPTSGGPSMYASSHYGLNSLGTTTANSSSFYNYNYN
jgi:hypothetical protein